MSVTLSANNQFFDKAMRLRNQIVQSLGSKAQEIARASLNSEQIDKEAFKLEFAGY